MAVKQTQREHAYRHIRRKLAEGSLPAGERLSPAALGREIGISHIPVREAISQLQSEGLIVHHSHRGAFVKAMSRREIVDLVEFRKLLECHAAAQAARRIASAQLLEFDVRWQECCRAVEAFNALPDADLCELVKNWHLADLAFHMVLFRAAGNRLSLRAIEDARVMTQMFGYRSDSPKAWADPPAWAVANLRVHEPIYDAVRRRDPKAARRAMVVHMCRAGKNMLDRFDWLERQNDADNRLVSDFPESVREIISDLEHRNLSEGLAEGG